MFPYRDENETQRPAIVTAGIIALNFLVWIFVQGAGSALPLASSVCNLGLIPGELTLSVPVGSRFPMGEGILCATDPGRQVSHIFTSMFLHGSWMHLLGNMWFLWIFGNNIEDKLGKIKFIVFYLLCGLIATYAQTLVSPSSGAPQIGASGAIAGVLGAYIVLFPRARVRTLFFFFLIFFLDVPAVVLLGLWFALQLLQGVGPAATTGGVAYMAHVGGFIAGMVLLSLFRPRRTAPPRSPVPY